MYTPHGQGGLLRLSLTLQHLVAAASESPPAKDFLQVTPFHHVQTILSFLVKVKGNMLCHRQARPALLKSLQQKSEV